MATLLAVEKQAVPDWATFSKTSIYPDFYKRAGYPSNITTPSNKHVIFEHDMLLDIEPRTVSGNLRNVIEFLGFKVDLKTNPVEGRVSLNSIGVASNFVYPAKEIVGGLVGDGDWCDASDPGNHSGNDYTQWHSDVLIARAANSSYIILDFEAHDQSVWTSAHWTRLAEIFNEVRAGRPWVKIGLWARHDAAIGPFFDPNNGGVVNEAGLNFYANMYENGPGSNVSGFYNNTGANAAFPFGYMKGRQSSQLPYNLMQTVEVSQKYNPTVLQIPTLWNEIEKIADYEGDDQDTILWHPRTDKVIRADEKLHTPPDIMLAFSLLSLTVWGGAYWFGTGSNYSDNINYADDIGVQPDNNGNSIYTETVRTKQFKVFYRWQYKGFVNYNVVANYMCSLEPFKSTIEASTPWIIPEYKRITEAVWQGGLKKYPSWTWFNGAPIIRLKYSQDGTKCIFFACNFTADLNVETWNFRIPNTAWEGTIELIGGWPELGYINVINV